MGVKFGMEEGTVGPLLHAKLHPHRCNMSPLRGEKPQNRPLSQLNTSRFELRNAAGNYGEVPACLIKIKYITIGVEKVASPVTALHPL